MADLLDRPTSVRIGEELDVSKLEPFLRSHWPNEPAPLGIQQFPSGHSNLTYSLQLGGKELVLRRGPFGSKVKTAHDMHREFRVLSRIHPVYPPAPKVLLYCDDAAVLGAPFYVMEPMHGVILRRTPPPALDFSPEKARRLSESFVENLARLHNLDYAAAGLADLGKPHGYVERQVRGWIDRYQGSKTHDYPEVDKIAAWMQGHLVPSTGSATLVHNDYKYDNVILDPADITKIIGVLDWEMCTIGDPLTDLATSMVYWVEASDPQEIQEIRTGPTTYPGNFTRGEIAEHYARKTGRDISDLHFFLALAYFKVAVILQQIYYRYHHGLTKDERFASQPARIHTLLRASLRCAQTGAI